MKLKHLMTGTALAVVSAGGAFADDHPSEWYMSFGAGANWVGNDTGLGGGASVARGFTNTFWTIGNTSTFITFICTGPANPTSCFTTLPGTFTTTASAPLNLEEDQVGFAILGSVGYKFEMPWRIELEASARFTDVKAVSPFYSGKGNLHAYALMANVIYDFNVTERLNFNIGAGAGYGKVRLDAKGTWNTHTQIFNTYTSATFCHTTGVAAPFTDCHGHFTTATTTATGTWRLEVDDEGFAYQGILGLSYAISDRAELYLDYRYFVIADLSFNAVGHNVFGGATGEDDYRAQNAMIGIRYYFGEEEAPPPPAAEVTKTFIVFFDFNKSNLTAEAQATIADAVAAYQQTGSVHVMVVGHTDTVGSASYNQGLSERRAGSVKAEMVRLGVPADNISTEGRGFSEPMVPTGPGVKEPQNRRAVIDIQ